MINKLKQETVFGDKDIETFIELYKKYPDETHTIKRQMKNFYKTQKYNDIIDEFFKWLDLNNTKLMGSDGKIK